jgi:endothelin-converting enzyme/putative endopeptidase
MLQFIGETPVQAKASAAKILALEIKMSNPRLDRVERRDGVAIQSDDHC